MPEIKKEKRRLQNGWELVRGDLTILVRDEDEQSLTRLTDGILADIAAG